MTEAEQMQRIEDKKICLIYTGGTIGMSRTDSGYAPIAGYFQHELDRIDDLRADGMPKYEFVEFSPLLDSSNITYVQWNMSRLHPVTMTSTDLSCYTAQIPWLTAPRHFPSCSRI